MGNNNNLLNSKIQVISLGLQSFSDALKNQNVTVTHVDWKPPAGGDMKMLAMLNLLKGKK